MVSELDEMTLEISSKVMNSQVNTPPLIGGITYGEQIIMSDIDAQLIDMLGNPNYYGIELKVGKKINVNDAEFIIDAVHKTICYSLKLIGSEGEKFMIYIKN